MYKYYYTSWHADFNHKNDGNSMTNLKLVNLNDTSMVNEVPGKANHSKYSVIQSETAKDHVYVPLLYCSVQFTNYLLKLIWNIIIIITCCTTFQSKRTFISYIT